MKVCLVGPSGRHLTHLCMLKPFWKDKDFGHSLTKRLLETFSKMKRCILAIIR